MMSYMHPFNIVAIYDIGYSWEEAELVVRGYAKDHNIGGEELEKMLSKKREMVISTKCNIHFEEDFP